MRIVILRYLSIIISLSCSSEILGQDLYKTPSGEKYHLSTCRMVKNVSAKIITPEGIRKLGLEPCKICHPPLQNAVVKSYSGVNKAVGEGKSVQCNGKTAAGTRCKHMTKIANGYCYQHTNQYKN